MLQNIQAVIGRLIARNRHTNATRLEFSQGLTHSGQHKRAGKMCVVVILPENDHAFAKALVAQRLPHQIFESTSDHHLYGGKIVRWKSESSRVSFKLSMIPGIRIDKRSIEIENEGAKLHQPGKGNRPRIFFGSIPATCFSIFCACRNCFSSRFTSSTDVPLPLAMRFRRLPLMRLWLLRSR